MVGNNLAEYHSYIAHFETKEGRVVLGPHCVLEVYDILDQILKVLRCLKLIKFVRKEISESCIPDISICLSLEMAGVLSYRLNKGSKQQDKIRIGNMKIR